MSFLTTIGLEVHVQLNTRSKLFCDCPNAFGAAPNTLVCPVCLGYPGAMPRLNAVAVRKTVQTGLMIGSRIPTVSRFDRKSYFYPDMPKNYQISQYDMPLCVGGSLEIASPDGLKRVGITRIHLEEDVGKCLHAERYSLLDFNRAGIPLMEIVTEPELSSAAEAAAFLHALKQVLQYLQVSDCNLEEGNLRCDVNVSVRPVSQTALGTKVEIKNLNTFRGVQQALAYEIERQGLALRGTGAPLVQETRRWDANLGRTESMRGKEDAHDYRYFPEPDLLPVHLSESQIESWRAALPERPATRRARFEAAYALSPYDAALLSADRALADYFESATARQGSPKTIAHLLMSEGLRLCEAHGRALAESALSPGSLGELAVLLDTGVINRPTAKDLLEEMFLQGGRPEAIVAARGLGQVSDDTSIGDWVRQSLEAQPGAVRDYLDGKPSAARFLVGQVMKRSRGKADPRRVAMAVETELSRLKR